MKAGQLLHMPLLLLSAGGEAAFEQTAVGATVLLSTNLTLVSMAFSRLREQDLDVGEIAPLLTNPLPPARWMGLSALGRIGTRRLLTSCSPACGIPMRRFGGTCDHSSGG